MKDTSWILLVCFIGTILFAFKFGYKKGYAEGSDQQFHLSNQLAVDMGAAEWVVHPNNPQKTVLRWHNKR